MFAKNAAPIAFALAALAVSPAAVMAADFGQAPSAAVRVADLDLASPSGQAVLMARVTRAADAICGRDAARTLAEKQVFQACRAEALSSAAPQLHAAIASAERRSAHFAMNKVSGPTAD